MLFRTSCQSFPISTIITQNIVWLTISQTATFKFLPIEPPRGPENGRESYARRQHQFAPKIDVPSKQGLFRKPTIPRSNTAVVPPNVSIDSRLPDPAIVNCNKPLPLRVLITMLNGGSATIYLQILIIELIGHTNIRAHQLQRTDSVSWVIMSASNLRMPLESRDTLGPGRDMEVDAKMWNQIPIPSTVAPSFETCNVTRNYSLHIKVGLSYGSSDKINVCFVNHGLVTFTSYLIETNSPN